MLTCSLASAAAPAAIAEPTARPWLARPRHRLIHVRAGTVRVELERAEWFLFAGRAGWIGSRVQHRLAADPRARLVVVEVAPLGAAAALPACGAFRAPTLLGEMVGYASARWGAEPPADPRAERFLSALVDVCAEQLEREPESFVLPRPRSAPVRRALGWALAHLLDASVEGMASAAGVAPRTLSRRFRHETGLSAGRYVHAVRMLRAMQMLAGGPCKVADAARAVGFDSLSAFSHAFREFAGQSPRAFRAGAPARSRSGAESGSIGPW